ncbi:unnamed protein product, partial [Bubo scandiacus]
MEKGLQPNPVTGIQGSWEQLGLRMSALRVVAIYVVCKLLGDAVSGFVYCINKCIIFSPKLKDNIISLGKLCHTLQELLTFL